MLGTSLTLERFGVAFGRRVVLASVDLVVGARGVTSLMGPVGVGKSTLLRTLAGRNDGERSLRTWGRASYLGAPLAVNERADGARERPALMGQGAKLLVSTVRESLVSAMPDRAHLQRGEQRARAAAVLEAIGFGDLVDELETPASELSKFDLRRTSLAAALATDPPLLLADEPTAGLREDERERVLEVLRRRGETAALLVVTHSQKDAMALDGRTALLAGGAVVEHADTKTFFAAPRSPIAQGFVETGSCAVASPPSLDELVADGLVPASYLALADRVDDPSEATPAPVWSSFPEPALSIRWIEEGALAGVPRPGLLGSVDRDLQTLAEAGFRTLVCLEESQVLSHDLLARYGIESHALPIADMDAPSIEDARALCALIDESIARGAPVAVHCRAGLGRTGTVLGAWLIAKGLDEGRALARLRRVEPRFVQSERQLDFLTEFARAEASARPSL